MRSFCRVIGLLSLLSLACAVGSQEGSAPEHTDPAGPTETRLEVMTLYYHTAEDLIPLLQPMLDGQGLISGRGDTLLLRVAPEQLQQVRALVERLDTPPRRLLVSVRQADDDAALPSDGSMRPRGGPAGTPLGGGGTLSTRRDRSVLQQVQVLEGHEAFISVGREASRAEGIVGGAFSGVEDGVEIRYPPLTTGFLVTPRLNGDEVTVAITPFSRVAGAAGRTRTRNVSSRISGRLGEWLLVGASREDTVASGTLSTRALRGHRQGVWLKVEILP